MTRAGYDVLNRVKSRKPLDPILFESVLSKFAASFPLLLDRERVTPSGAR